MIDKYEIIRIAELMKIHLDDHADHITRVQKMLEYFDILDNANVESEEITAQEIDLNDLGWVSQDGNDGWNCGTFCSLNASLVYCLQAPLQVMKFPYRKSGNS